VWSKRWTDSEQQERCTVEAELWVQRDMTKCTRTGNIRKRANMFSDISKTVDYRTN